MLREIESNDFDEDGAIIAESGEAALIVMDKALLQASRSNDSIDPVVCAYIGPDTEIQAEAAK